MKIVCATVAALAFAGSAGADTINVPAGGDIQAAINGASDGDIIQLEAGGYFPSATIDTLGKAVTLRGVPGKGKGDAPTTVIDGQDSIRVLICENEETALTVFENLMITGGLADGDSPDNRGGGMYNEYYSSPTLIDCTFEGNSAVDGGGMYNEFNSSPTLSDCTFTGNSADDFGGGMSNDRGSPTLTGCTFEGNSADDDGGGMANLGFSSPTLSGCTFTGNLAADEGGGMYNEYWSSPTLTNCTFTGNSAGYGGGMRNYSNSSPTLTGCTFTGNSSDGGGGGMRNAQGSSPTLTDTTVCNNTPDQVKGPWTDQGGNCISESCSPDCFCENDQDGDGICDEDDQCPGEPDIDSDGDGVVDCLDGCPTDPAKTAPGQCGCNEIDTGIAGDFDCDGDFDADDYAAMGTELGVCAGDINGDGIVDGADMGLLLGAWGPCMP
ncbi:MAG: right-handed parallel beta-helix repeat-containing protein [Myxococcota bacterium]